MKLLKIIHLVLILLALVSTACHKKEKPEAVLLANKGGYIHYTISGKQSNGTPYTYEEKAEYYIDEISGVFRDDAYGNENTRSFSFQRFVESSPDIWNGGCNSLSLAFTLDNDDRVVSCYMQSYIFQELSEDKYFATYLEDYISGTSGGGLFIVNNFSYLEGIAKGNFTAYIPANGTNIPYEVTINGDFSIEMIEVVSKK